MSSIISPFTPQSEVDLIENWWARGGYNAAGRNAIERQRAIVELAALRARHQVWSRRPSGLDGLGRSLAFFHNQKTPALKGADRTSSVREGQSPHGRDFRLGQARAEYGSVGARPTCPKDSL
jgi:hypothetical protein